MKLFVNSCGCDDVGSILDSLGQGFEHEPADAALSSPPEESILFLNCLGDVPLSAGEVRRFLELGGTVYASCYQADFLEGVVGDSFSCSSPLPRGRMKAAVLDQSLAEVIGSTIELEMNTSWKWLVPNGQGSDRTRVFLKAHQDVHGESEAVREGVPMVLSHGVGKGTLFFTAFHNSVQKSEREKDLLRFLLFRPIMQRALDQQRQQFEPARIAREYTGGLRASAPERAFDLPSGGPWSASLTWSGQGKLLVALAEGNGRPLANRDGWKGPLQVAGEVPAGGRVVVKCIEFVQAEIPFSLVVASGTGGRGGEPVTPVAAVSRPLVLSTADGRKKVFRVRTAVGPALMKDFGEDARFLSDPQFTVTPAGGSWTIEPSASARNATIVNRSACTSPTALKAGDEISVGNPVTGNIRLPMKVGFE